MMILIKKNRIDLYEHLLEKKLFYIDAYMNKFQKLLKFYVTQKF